MALQLLEPALDDQLLLNGGGIMLLQAASPQTGT